MYKSRLLDWPKKFVSHDQRPFGHKIWKREMIAQLSSHFSLTAFQLPKNDYISQILILLHCANSVLWYMSWLASLILIVRQAVVNALRSGLAGRLLLLVPFPQRDIIHSRVKRKCEMQWWWCLCCFYDFLVLLWHNNVIPIAILQASCLFLIFYFEFVSNNWRTQCD